MDIRSLLTCLCILTVFNSALCFGPMLIIDHDGGADDAMAIFMALLNEKYFNGPRVIAITTVHGNVPEPQVFINTQRILNIAERPDIPIYRGAASALIEDAPFDNYFGKDGLGDNKTVAFKPIEAQGEIAANAFIDLANKYKDALTIVNLGPLTNMALAIKLDPEITSTISQTYLAASYIYTKGISKIEFNVHMDVEAYYSVLKNGTADKITLIPSTQVKTYLNLGRQWRRETFGAINTDIVRALNVFERISMAKSIDWTPLDPSAMALVLDPSLVLEKRTTKNSVYLCGKLRGKTMNDFKSSTPNARLIFSADSEAYKEFLIKTFSAPLNDVGSDDSNSGGDSDGNDDGQNDNDDGEDTN